MTTRFRAPDKNISIYDTRGAARFGELRAIAKLDAQATAIIYRVTGVVAKNVAPRLRRWVYGVQKGEISMGRDFLKMLDVLTGMVSQRLMSLVEARNAAEELLAIGRQLIDLKLPVTSPDRPTLTGATTTRCFDAGREQLPGRDRRGAGDGVLPLYGSDDRAAA